MSRPRTAARRTQEERRSQTIEKLLDATAASLSDVGYAKTTAAEIATRAGVSQGGLFRHFPTTDLLMAKTGAHVGKKLLESYRRRYARNAPKKGEPDIAFAIRLLRDHCRSRENQAFYELFVAARTNAALKKALGPVVREYYAQITALAEELFPDLVREFGTDFFVFADTVIAVFDGDTMHGWVTRTKEIDEPRLVMLGRMAAALMMTIRGSDLPPTRR